MFSTSLHLYKQNFKFSSAHFLIFDQKSAEKLHGHNYYVKVDFEFAGQTTPESGFMVDFGVLKKQIHARLMEWDEMVLLPGKNPEIKTELKGPTLEVRFRERFYAFPANEVHLLPITNTSVENLSKLLATEFLQKFKVHGVTALTVSVEETAGQSGSFKAQL